MVRLNGESTSKKVILGHESVARMAFMHGDYRAALRHLMQIQEAMVSGSVISAEDKRAIEHLAGKIYLGLKMYAEAEIAFKNAMKTDDNSGVPVSDRLSNLRHLADCYLFQHRLAECGSLLEESHRLASESHLPFESAKISLGQGRLFIEMGDLEHASRCLNETFSRLEQIGKANTFWYGRCLLTYARLLFKQGKLTESEETLDRGLNIIEPLVGPEHPLRISALKGRARLAESQGRDDDAHQLFSEAASMEHFLSLHDR
jgi:tetratricopeptide (TPR) repeat protein